MGRPRGDKPPLTGVERQHRYWEKRLREAAAGAAADGNAELARARAELTDAKAHIARLDAEVRRLRTEAKRMRDQHSAAASANPPSDDIVALQRQLKAVRTRVANLTQENHLLRAERNAKPTVIAKRDYNRLRKIFHPDTEASVTDERRRQLTEAAQLFNALKFNVME